MAWYATAGRHDLPWRRTRDPYAVLVSKVMLQQTQVERVLPKYAEFLAAFPTLAALADAPVAKVIRRSGGRSATTGAPCGSGSRRGRPSTAAACHRASTRCGRCQGAGHTRRRPSRASPSGPALRSSIRTCAACWAAPSRATPPSPTPRRGGSARRSCRGARAATGHSRSWISAQPCAPRELPRAARVRWRAPASGWHSPLALSLSKDEPTPSARRARHTARAAASGSWGRAGGIAAVLWRRCAARNGASIGLTELGAAVRDGYDDAEHGAWLRELLAALATDGLAASDGERASLPPA